MRAALFSLLAVPSFAFATECDLPRVLVEVSTLAEPFSIGFVACALAVFSAIPARMLIRFVSGFL